MIALSQPRALTEAVRNSEIIASGFNIKYSAKKNLCIKFRSKAAEVDNILPDGFPMKCTDQVKHLEYIVIDTLTHGNYGSLKNYH